MWTISPHRASQGSQPDARLRSDARGRDGGLKDFCVDEVETLSPRGHAALPSEQATGSHPKGSSSSIVSSSSKYHPAR
jgi:hypothetical protein